jgi:CobQ-like glutamine amidotransferase family enzyme
VPKVHDRVLVYYGGIQEMREIVEIRIIHNGEKRYLVGFENHSGNEIQVWRRLSISEM